MTSVPDFFQPMAMWLSQNRERFAEEVQTRFGEPVPGRSLVSAYVDIWTEELGAHAVVWENGSVEVTIGSTVDDSPLDVIEYQISDPSQLSPILERHLAEFLI